MELSLEMLIVKQVGGNADLATLCRVNKRFQQAAEQVLYNTIWTSSSQDSFRVCGLFARTPRLAVMVESLSLLVGDGEDSDSVPSTEICLPSDFWATVSRALHQTTGLRFLKLLLENTGDSAQAWILNGTVFRLRGFHCDLQWDADLVSFLNTQLDINDLYILDFPVETAPASTSTSSSLDPGALPSLSTLQCTFIEAACALVPNRPISRLKTCFSKTRFPEKREELSLLFSKLMKATHPLHSFDIADSSYSDSYSMELLTSVVGLQGQVYGLRYLGTFVLPIDGDVRLKFYGLLRTLSFLECVEVDVTEWEPPPAIPAGVRALASELRLYCSSLRRVIFVNDFERTVMAVAEGTYVLDDDASADNIWREF